ncbi:DUF2313 domain-containing protein [Burkholderia contaminans]|uniref:YmfQ family protein n=1 Tax=Burkholderia TaxID=32008 RepID=UPI0010F7711B|nr:MULTISPECIES: putative phage tail protein [Burkholderia]MBD1412849.1 DUF2313 domain-containing protein [Burkholderia contaminans]UXZ68700.1 DUF2313 domain-containing protein [Burkholderia contaminans]UXZ76461.1 DUF2313 domain-containing protein [Burkholderia contaminans]
MAAPIYSSDDFTRALHALFPRGRVWPRDSDATQSQAIAGLAAIYARNASRSAALLVDSFPASTLELLPEWESTLGLPDPCAGESPTIQQRRNQVVARFANSGGQSAAYFKSFALNLGYTVAVRNFAPFRCGQSRAGDSLGGVEWFYTWAINAPLNTVTRFRTGQSTAGEALATWNNAVLECELKAVSPAHTYLLFQYS